MAGTVRLPLEQLQPYLLEQPAEHGKLDWHAVFGNDQPVEIEVGCGKGLFLLTAAMAFPDVNYLGIEIERKYQLFTANRIAKRHLANVRLACADARILIRDHVADSSVRAIHTYFPDPWWKNRHRKRRLFNELFVVQVQRILIPNGCLHLATDVHDYFQFITSLISRHTSLRQSQLNAEEIKRLDSLTNFEKKYREQGRPIYRAVYVKD